MKIQSSRRFRYWVVNAVEGKPGALKSAFIRGAIYSLLLCMFTPLKAAGEISFGSSNGKTDLKSSLRAMLWLLNRSWIPLKHPMGTFFDLGWWLSEESCEGFIKRGFLSKPALKHKSDLAQLKLAAIRQAMVSGSESQLQAADGEVLSLVSEIFTEGHQWADSAIREDYSPDIDVRTQLAKQPNQTKSFDNDNTRQALLDFDDLCHQIRQPYFLVSGTFLGVVRDGSFIGHDHDIDLGIFEHDLNAQLLPALQSSNQFQVTQVDYISLRLPSLERVNYKQMHNPAIIKIAHKNGIGIDVFVHFIDGDLAWHGSSIHRWDNRIFPLVDYPFLGRQFKGAKDFELYLTENYGSDWRTPKPDFDSSLDTPNMSFVGSANALVFYSWMIARCVAEQQPERVRKYITMLQRLWVLELKGGQVRVI
jgi:hypothetical protein